MNHIMCSSLLEQNLDYVLSISQIRAYSKFIWKNPGLRCTFLLDFTCDIEEIEETLYYFSFRRVSEQQSSLQANQMNARNLAVVFSPTLMRPDFTLPLVMNPTGGPGGGIHPQNINAQNMNEIMFLRTCIEQYQLLFDDDEQKKNIAEAIVD